MLLRQVQARPLQGHHLRALRRRGDAAEGAPRAYGPHRPGRAGLAYLVLQGRPRRGSATCSTSPRASSRRCSTSPPRSSPTSTRRRGRRTSPTSRTRCAVEYERARRRPRGAAGGARAAAQPPAQLPERRAPTGASTRTTSSGSRPRQLGGGAGDADARGRARDSSAACWPSGPKMSTEDAKKIRELVRYDGDPRRSPAPRRASSRTSPRRRSRSETALAPLRKELAKATGSKKGAITKHLNRVLDALLGGGELNEEDAALVAGVDQKKLETDPRPRQRPAQATSSSRGRPRADDDGAARARERPLPAHRREDPEGGPRRDRRLAAEGARDVPRHRAAARGRARGRGRGARPPGADLARCSRSSSRRWSSTTSRSSGR